MKSNVYVVKTDFNSVHRKMDKLIKCLKLPPKADRIAIKINLCDFRRRETGAISDPLVVDPLLSCLKKIYPSSEIILVENDASAALADVLFSYAGFSEVAKKYNAKCVNLAHEKWVSKKIDGYYFREIEVPRVLNDADLVITHPKLKTISLTKITCGLKNMFGCIRIKGKHKYHRYIDECIVDINLALRPACSIVDAILCHEGTWGPAYGVPKKVNMLIGGNDVVAVDAFCSKLAGFHPLFIGHLRKAQSKGLGNMSFEISGDLSDIDLKECKFDFNNWIYYTIKVLRKLGIETA